MGSQRGRGTDGGGNGEQQQLQQLGLCLWTSDATTAAAPCPPCCADVCCSVSWATLCASSSILLLPTDLLGHTAAVEGHVRTYILLLLLGLRAHGQIGVRQNCLLPVVTEPSMLSPCVFAGETKLSTLRRTQVRPAPPLPQRAAKHACCPARRCSALHSGCACCAACCAARLRGTLPCLCGALAR